jgi:hypothetical protein
MTGHSLGSGLDFPFEVDGIPNSESHRCELPKHEGCEIAKLCSIWGVAVCSRGWFDWRSSKLPAPRWLENLGVKVPQRGAP